MRQSEDQDKEELGKEFEAYKDAVESGNTEQATALSFEIFAKLAEMPPPELTPSQQAEEEAALCEENFDWAGAEAAYKRALELAADKPSELYSAARKLCSFYRLLELDDLALPAAKISSTAVREMEMPVWIPHTLATEVGLHLKFGNFEVALKLINEALTSVEEGRFYDLQRALTLIMRSFYYIETETFENAKADLNAAWLLLEARQKDTFAGGVQGTIATWWVATAHLRSKRGDLMGAVAALREDVTRSRIIAQLPQSAGIYTKNGLAKALHELGKAQQEAGDSHAKYSFRESQSIRRSIGLPPLGEPMPYPLPITPKPAESTHFLKRLTYKLRKGH